LIRSNRSAVELISAECHSENRKSHRQYTCGNTFHVFPYGGIIRIRLKVGIIVRYGFPLSPSFIELPIARLLYHRFFILSIVVLKIFLIDLLSFSGYNGVGNNVLERIYED